jgi:hypothetical protein
MQFNEYLFISKKVFGFNRLLSNKISDFSPSELKRWQCRICRNKDFDENAIEEYIIICTASFYTLTLLKWYIG